MKFYNLSDATFYDRINYIYQFIKPFYDKNAPPPFFFEEYGALEILVVNEQV